MSWKRITSIVAVVLMASVLATTSIFVGRNMYRERCRKLHLAEVQKKRIAALQQVVKAMEHYAQVSEGHYYPLRSSKQGVFLPDFDEWEKIAPDKAEFEQARKTLTDPNERPLCYTGYAFKKEFQGLQFLDALEKDAQGLRGGGPTDEEIRYVSDALSPEVDKLHPYRDGVEKQFMWDWEFHGNVPSKWELVGDMPILWEMPGKEGEACIVIDMMGSYRLSRYPGQLPYSFLFINRLRGLMGLPQESEFCNDAPIIPIVRSILNTLGRNFGSDAGCCQSIDNVPSVTTNNCNGYRVKFESAELVLFPENEPAASLSPDTLFTPITLKKDYWGCGPCESEAFIGSGKGYHWYGKMQYYSFCLLRKEFHLVGGGDLYLAAAAYCRNEFLSTAWWSERKWQGGISDTMENIMWDYSSRRIRKNRPISKTIIDAGAILKGTYWDSYGHFTSPSADIVEEAKQRLIEASKTDAEGAAAAALFYVLPYHCRGPRGGPTKEGLELLNKLPQDGVASAKKFLLGDSGPIQKIERW